MKTIYQKPETIIVDVELQNLMSVSNDNDNNVKSVSFSTTDYDGDADILSRGDSSWDDDEY